MKPVAKRSKNAAPPDDEGNPNIGDYSHSGSDPAGAAPKRDTMRTRIPTDLYHAKPTQMLHIDEMEHELGEAYRLLKIVNTTNRHWIEKRDMFCERIEAFRDD